MDLVWTSGELRVLDMILQRLSNRTEEGKDLVNVYQEDVELIESLTNKVQQSVSHREEHGRMTLKHTTKHMDALQHWLEAEREVRNSHKDDSTREN